jgi:hypothetical protein
MFSFMILVILIKLRLHMGDHELTFSNYPNIYLHLLLDICYLCISIIHCETWVPLGPHRPGSRPSLTSGSSLPEDLLTCQWAQLA